MAIMIMMMMMLMMPYLRFMMTAYKCLNGLAPAYLADDCVPVSSVPADAT